MQNNSAPLLDMRGIRKRFSSVEVLHGVNLTLHRGEVLALMGENGAGKSTLMKILNGDYPRDGGEILIDGKPMDFKSPRDAEAAGVRVIYQELNYAPDLSVAENILMGHLPRKGGIMVDWAETHRRATQILGQLKADINSRQLMGSLSVGKQQLVEIAKALSSQARILVMDEPTAALTSREVHLLFDTIASLRAQGVGIVYISHRLDEVEQIAQRVNVLRDGKEVGDVEMKDVTRGDIVRMMVGRDVETLYPARQGEPGRVVLEVSGLTRGHHFQDVNFSVRENEIVGLYGLLGAGQMEVMRALFGSPPAAMGEIKVAGQPVTASSPQHAKKHGIGLVSEDRKREGLVLGMSVSDNLTLGNWEGIARSGVLQSRVEQERAAHWTQRLGIRARSGPSQTVGTLSGGNQQKVVLARWLEAGTKVLLLAEPTRGVDVGARADIYQVLEELREQGLALVMVSTDMEEVLALSDRILVFERGRVVREFNREEATQELLLATAAGDNRR
jgi:ribose transport system ATP-binding protein